MTASSYPWVDALVSRAVRGNASATPAAAGPVAVPDTTPPTAEERAVLASAGGFLRSGLELKAWYEAALRSGNWGRRFALTRAYHRAESSFGFFADNGSQPIMGAVQEMFYDQPRSPRDQSRDAARWMKEQIREFVLHYFMRVSSFREPETVAQGPGGRYSWCGGAPIERSGFGYRQLFYGPRGSSSAGRFPQASQSAITDLRRLGPTYDWLIARVEIYDFSVAAHPFGGNPSIGFELPEESHLILSPEYVVDREAPAPGILGEYGFGYSFIHSPTPSLLAYGPGQFDAAFQNFLFRVFETGEIQVTMAFVANRPRRVTNISLNPVRWAMRLGDAATLGLFSRALGPARGLLDALSRPELVTVDPVFVTVDAANWLTGGELGRRFCISRERIDQVFLAQHSRQHYRSVSGSLLTWRQVPDWLNRAALPQWVVTGKSS